MKVKNRTYSQIEGRRELFENRGQVDTQPRSSQVVRQLLGFPLVGILRVLLFGIN